MRPSGVLLLSIPILWVQAKSIVRDSATTCDSQVHQNGGCDVMNDPTCCVDSTTVAVCLPDSRNGENPSHWLFYGCPDSDETCQWASGDGEYGCVGVRFDDVP